MLRLLSLTGLRLTVVCLALGLLGISAPARADRKAEAAQAAARADRAFSAGAHQQALAGYQASYARYPKPFLLFKMAECQRLLGHDADALSGYRAYLAKVSRGADRRRAAAYVADLDPKVAAPSATAAAPVAAPAPVAQSSDTEAPPMRAEEVARLRAEEQRKKGKSREPSITTSSAPREDRPPPGYDPANLVRDPLEPATIVIPEPVVPGPKPLYAKWWLWTAVGGVVVVGVGVGLGLALGLPRFSSELPVGGPGASALSVRP